MARISTAEMEVKLSEINESVGLLMEMNDVVYRKHWPNVIVRIIEVVHTFSEMADELEKTMMLYEENVGRMRTQFDGKSPGRQNFTSGPPRTLSKVSTIDFFF